jgi:hypothetical protein
VTLKSELLAPTLRPLLQPLQSSPLISAKELRRFRVDLELEKKG